MIEQSEMDFFRAYGYLHAKNILNSAYVSFVRAEFDRIWELEPPPFTQFQLLKHKTFIDLIEYELVLSRIRAFFGVQTQLLQYALSRQDPLSSGPERSWQRDFTFPGERPLAICAFIPLDELNEERGPIRVIPGSQRGEELPDGAEKSQERPDEVTISAGPGDVVFINAATWYSNGVNRGPELRRGIALCYGYWWLKRFESDCALPWQAFENASEQRLQLLGVRMPSSNLYRYPLEK